jgi:hypothetical protein
MNGTTSFNPQRRNEILSERKGLCLLCNRNKRLLEHHISYFPQIIIHICRSCHKHLHAIGLAPSQLHKCLFYKIWHNSDATLLKWIYPLTQPIIIREIKEFFVNILHLNPGINFV